MAKQSGLFCQDTCTKKVNGGSVEFRFPNVEDYCKHQYFELMESLSEELA